MKKQISITLAAIMLAGLTACGASAPAASSEATAPASSESEATAEEPSADSELDATVDEAEQALSDIGSIDVDKGLFDVTITFPADFASDITQEEIDQQVADGKVHSGQINEDGSVTYVMSKDQHKAIVDAISESIQSTLDGMVGTEDYPNFTAIDHNEDYTSFTVKTTTKPGETAISDSMSVLFRHLRPDLRHRKRRYPGKYPRRFRQRRLRRTCHVLGFREHGRITKKKNAPRRQSWSVLIDQLA